MDKDTKIAVISSSCMRVPPETYGGLELIVHLLSKTLAEKNYDVTLIAPQTSKLEGGKVIETVKPRQTVDAFKYENKAFQMYKDYLPNFDIICDHSVGYDERIVIREKEGRPKVVKIGKFVDEILGEEQNSETKSASINDVEVLTVVGNELDRKCDVKWRSVNAVMRHKADSLLNLSLKGGLEVEATGDHALYEVYRTSRYTQDNPQAYKSLRPISAKESKGKTLAVAPELPNNNSRKETIRIPIEDLDEKFFVRADSVPQRVEENKEELKGEVDSNWPSRLLLNWKQSNKVPSNVLPIIGYPKEGFLCTHHGAEVPLNIELSDDLLRFFGLWIADGCYDRSATRISEPDAHGLVKKVADSFNLDVSHPSHRPDVNIQIEGKSFKLMMKALGFEGKSHTKRIPKWVFGLSEEQIKSFIDGWILGDGYRDKQEGEYKGYGMECERVRIGSVSKDLIMDLYMLCKLVGIMPTIYTEEMDNEKIHGYKVDSSERIWVLSFHPDVDKNRPTVRRHKVKEINETDADYAYDLSVEGCERFLSSSLLAHNSWQKFSYLAKARNPEKMEGTKVCSVMHGMAQDMSPPPVEHPNFITVSKTAAQEWSEKVGIPFRHAYNSVPVELYDLKKDKKDYLMTLNRIQSEKGIHEFVGLMKRLRKKAKVVGEDRFVDSHQYVSQIQSMCDQMMVEYLGRVSTEKKVELLQNAKALILTPIHPYREVFGMSAVEANLTGTPTIVLSNCGLTEVIEDGVNGYLASSVDEIGEIIESGKIEDLDPEECRNYVMRRFTPKRMTNRYLTLFEDILEKDKEW